MTILSSFPQLLDGNILFGIGNYYFECFTLNAILQYGIIVGTLAIAIGAYPSFWSLVNKENIKNKEAGMFLLISSVASFICGLFEAIAPVGPGIKFYILWLSFGFLLGFNYKAAIGEPLTLMLKNFILSKVAEPDSLIALQKIVTPEMVEILKDATAYENFKQITGIE